MVQIFLIIYTPPPGIDVFLYDPFLKSPFSGIDMLQIELKFNVTILDAVFSSMDLFLMLIR